MKPYIAIPIIAALVHRAVSRKSLTFLGIVAAAFTAVAHAVHPWSAPLILLCVFYLGGTKVTKVKHDVKARLTLSATGSHGGEGQRTHIQVLANSVVATVLILLHVWATRNDTSATQCFSSGQNAADLLVAGFVANYAAVAADTYSSELGILSTSKPRLITSLSLRVVPPGTNGGVTGTGLLAGLLGAFSIGVTSAVLLPFCAEGDDLLSALQSRAQWILAVTIWGGIGSVLDSVLGGLLQASVVDKRTGKVVEGMGGEKVLIHSSTGPKHKGTTNASGYSSESTGNVQLRNTKSQNEGVELSHESRRVESGWDILDNNGVNVLMALLMSVGGMGVAAWIWGISISDINMTVSY